MARGLCLCIYIYIYFFFFFLRVCFHIVVTAWDPNLLNQVTGLLGHNGAGKTTTISCLTGALSISGGDIYVKGRSMQTHVREIRQMIGICPQKNVLHCDLTVEQHLQVIPYVHLNGSSCCSNFPRLHVSYVLCLMPADGSLNVFSSLQPLKDFMDMWPLEQFVYDFVFQISSILTASYHSLFSWFHHCSPLHNIKHLHSTK